MKGATDFESEAGRLLALSAVPPWPACDGYSVRVGHLLEEVSQDWSVTLLSPATSASEGAAAPEGIEWIQLPDVPATTVLPWRDERDLLIGATRSLLEDDEFDVAVLWNGTEYVASEVDGFPPAVADRIDCETLQAWRSRKHRWWGLRRKLQELRRGLEMAIYERSVLRRMDGLTATTAVDARALALVTGHDRVVVVPNGVTLPTLSEYPDEAPVPTVIFTGVLGFPPNVEATRHFVDDVWPLVRASVPRARFVVAGRSPVPPELDPLNDREAVTVRRDVPDITAELRRAWVAVAPMRSGSGVKNKVLEAWAAGRPVVMTELATTGVRLDDAARELVVAEPREMAERVDELLRDEGSRRDYGSAGRRLVADRHSWSSVASPLKELVKTVTVPSTSPAGDR